MLDFIPVLLGPGSKVKFLPVAGYRIDSREIVKLALGAGSITISVS